MKNDCDFCFHNRNLISLNCKHSICEKCLYFLFQTGLKDIFKLPLECCGKIIPRKYLQELCSKQEWNKYENFLYVVQKLQHFKQKNPNDQTLQEIKKEENWATCPKCFNTIERNYGCNKMTCVCKVIFCYSCELYWNKCKCIDNFRRIRSVWERFLIFGVDPLPTIPIPKFSPWSSFQERVEFMTSNNITLRTEPGKSNMCFTKKNSKLFIRHLQLNPKIAQLVMESCLPWEIELHLVLLMPRMKIRTFEPWPVNPWSICAVVDAKHFHKFVEAGVEIDTGFNMNHRTPKCMQHFLPFVNYHHSHRDFFNFGEGRNNLTIYD